MTTQNNFQTLNIDRDEAMDPLTFDELRSFLHESTQGRVFDSLICVEIGLDEYNAAWDAHVDMSNDYDFHDTIVRFLSDVADYIGVSECDFDKATVEAPGGA